MVDVWDTCDGRDLELCSRCRECWAFRHAVPNGFGWARAWCTGDFGACALVFGFVVGKAVPAFREGGFAAVVSADKCVAFGVGVRHSRVLRFVVDE